MKREVYNTENKFPNEMKSL